MGETKWTPGEWRYTPSSPPEGFECFWITACPEPNQEREVATVSGPQNERNEANAHLIAAAPALYSALQQLLDEAVEAGFDSAVDYNWPKSIADARSALAKARGEP